MNSLVGKKILFVITKSNWGGAQQYVYTLATRLKAAGNEVAVVLGGTGAAGAGAGLLETRLREAGVRTIFLTSFARDVNALREYTAFSELRRVLHEERPDVLHLNSSKAGGLGALAGRIAGIPRILFTAHGWPHREARSAIARTLIWIVSWITVVLSHKTIAVSACDQHDAPAVFFRKKVTLIHNGINAALPLLRAEDARSRLYDLAPHLEIAVPRIVCIGELTRNKAYDVLIPALARIIAPFSCIIMGDGEERARLLALIDTLHLNSKVACVGFVTDASALLSGAALLVLPSRKEGFPFVLLEAGRAGLAVVASDTGGISELITDGVTGSLVPPEDSRALAAAIDRQLKDETFRIMLGKNLRERVAKEFSEKNMLEQTFVCYER